MSPFLMAALRAEFNKVQQSTLENERHVRSLLEQISLVRFNHRDEVDTLNKAIDGLQNELAEANIKLEQVAHLCVRQDDIIKRLRLANKAKAKKLPAKTPTGAK